MEKNEIIEIAKKAIEEKGWQWENPITILQQKKYIFFGQPMWKVFANSNMEGRNIFLLIDDSNGRVLNISITPKEINRNV